MKVSGSIVLYNSSFDEIKYLLNTIDNCIINKLYIIDNSEFDKISKFLNRKKIVYIHNSYNLGFGAAHNIAITKSLENNFDFHFIINPDITLSADIFKKMLQYMTSHKDVGIMMPKVLNSDKSIQYLPKLLPSLFSIIMRKIKWPNLLYRNFIDKYELRFIKENQTYITPMISGCFNLIRLDAIKLVGMYDERFFMYLEDWDLSRRIYNYYKTIYYSDVSVIHGYNSEANRSIKLLISFLFSVFKYFNKWGWFFDYKRKKINFEVLNQFN
tara:strand:+ start:194 stop:1003 length:810 start_codon:yes stop_codon:yes gene_type:complete